MGGRIVN